MRALQFTLLLVVLFTAAPAASQTLSAISTVKPHALNVRSEPSPYAEILGKLEAGDQVYVTPVGAMDWVFVSNDELMGYTKVEHLRIEQIVESGVGGPRP